MVYSDCGLSLYDTAKKLNQYPSLIDVFLKNYKKAGNYHQKESSCCKRKTSASEDTKIVKAAKQGYLARIQQYQNNSKWKLNISPKLWLTLLILSGHNLSNNINCLIKIFLYQLFFWSNTVVYFVLTYEKKKKKRKKKKNVQKVLSFVQKKLYKHFCCDNTLPLPIR